MRKVSGGKKGFVYMSFSLDDLNRTIDNLTESKEGRKLIRRASRQSLEIFNEESIENSSKLQLKKSGRDWRKTLKRKGSYQYKYKVSKKRFHTWTGINYAKKPILKVSHLVERGFSHKWSGKRIKGKWFRKRAYDQNKKRVMDVFRKSILKGINTITKTGRAPTQKELRNIIR